MDWTRAKARTEVLVPWITVAALIPAAGYSVCQYQAHKAEKRIENTMGYVARFMTSPLSDHRAALEKQWQGNQAEILKTLKRTDIPQDKINRDYYNKIVSMVASSKASGSVHEMILFYEQLANCVNANVCDRPTVTSMLTRQGQIFFRQHYPYICHLRSEWRDPSIGHQLETFFNPTSVGKACKS
jgi:hypothetical protein